MTLQLDDLKYKIKSPFLDIGEEKQSLLLFGMGRSGTTWAADIINYDTSYRVLFEPFFPALVAEARDFAYIQYMNPANENPVLAAGARTILAGKIRNRWVDRDNTGILYRRRIIKDIRCNLMAAWLKKLAPHLPVIQVIRHPLQVACSWRRLGWGTEALGKRSDFDIIIAQTSLLEDFPNLREIANRIDPDDFLDNVLFLWGVFHCVPGRQFRHDEIYFLFYEHLLDNPEEECGRIFRYLKKPYSWRKVQKAFARTSSTNFQDRNLTRERDRLLAGWKKECSRQEIRRAHEILEMFGLESLYDANGKPAGGSALLQQ